MYITNQQCAHTSFCTLHSYLHNIVIINTSSTLPIIINQSNIQTNNLINNLSQNNNVSYISITRMHDLSYDQKYTTLNDIKSIIMSMIGFKHKYG